LLYIDSYLVRNVVTLYLSNTGGAPEVPGNGRG